MNAPETLKPTTAQINLAHEVLLKADEALCVEEVARAILCGDKPTKACIKDVSRQLKKLADLGMIEMEPRAGGVPFYRLIVVPAVQVGDIGVADIAQPAECVAASGDSEGGETDAPLNFATSPELQYLAPEDYEMPPADPALLAMANRAISGQLDEFRAQFSSIAETVAPYLPDPSDISTARAVEILDMLADAQSKYIRMLELDAKGAHGVADRLMRQINELRTRAIEQASQHRADIASLRTAHNHAINEADRLRAELAAERQAREALQEQNDGVDVKDAAVGYLVRVPKRAPILRRKPESARSAALSAVRAGASRAEVLAVVPVGTARRGAEWQSTEAGG